MFQGVLPADGWYVVYDNRKVERLVGWAVIGGTVTGLTRGGMLSDDEFYLHESEFKVDSGSQVQLKPPLRRAD